MRVPRKGRPPNSGLTDQTQVSWYLNSISKRPLLKAHEEIELSRAVQQLLHVQRERKQLTAKLGRLATHEETAAVLDVSAAELHLRVQAGERARELMLVSNLRLVVSIAKRYRNQGMLFEDVIQEGNLGLLKATEKFDPERKLRFSTYATYWIRQGIARSLANQSRVIRLPAYVHDFLLRLRQARAVLTVQLGRAATEDELADRLGVKADKVRQAGMLPTTVALETPVARDGGGNDFLTLGQLIPCPHSDSAEQLLDASMLREELGLLLKLALPEVERDVMRLRYGLDDGVTKSLAKVGSIVQLSHTRVRALEHSALNRLRRPHFLERLEAFLEVDSP